jgi:preprotein translocase subunit SecE
MDIRSLVLAEDAEEIKANAKKTGSKVYNFRSESLWHRREVRWTNRRLLIRVSQVRDLYGLQKP